MSRCACGESLSPYSTNIHGHCAACESAMETAGITYGPALADDDGYDPCACCGGPPDCDCEIIRVPVYDPDGRPTGSDCDACATHRCEI